MITAHSGVEKLRRDDTRNTQHVDKCSLGVSLLVFQLRKPNNSNRRFSSEEAEGQMGKFSALEHSGLIHPVALIYVSVILGSFFSSALETEAQMFSAKWILRSPDPSFASQVVKLRPSDVKWLG